MSISNNIRAYLDNMNADTIAIVCEINKGETVALIAPIDSLLHVVAETVRIDKKAESTGGALQYRGKPGTFRKVLSTYYPNIKSIPGVEIVKFGDTSTFLADYELWRKGRNRYAWNIGNYAEFRLALYFGDAEHAERNTEKGFDILTKDGRKIECKALVKNCAFQIPIIENLNNCHCFD